MLRLNKMILSLIVIFFMGCNINNNQVDNKGGISLTIPNINSKIVSSFLTMEKDSSKDRAFSIINKARFLIYSSDILIDTFEVLVDLESDFKTTDLVLNEGEYRLGLEIYNLANSYTVPVVFGDSDLFTITAGNTTPVHINLIPYIAESLTEGLTTQITDFTCTQLDTNIGMLATGSEYWYEINPTSNITEVMILNNISQYNSFIVSIYDVDGSFLYSSNYGEKRYLFNSIPDDTYYMCIIPISVINNGTEYIPSTVNFSYVAYKILNGVDVQNISVSSNWLNLNIPSGASEFYSFDVTSGNNYTVAWDDRYQGSGAYDADVWVSCFDATGYYYFIEQDTGYNSPQSITVPEGITTLYLEINAFWGDGTLGLKVDQLD